MNENTTKAETVENEIESLTEVANELTFEELEERTEFETKSCTINFCQYA